MSDQQTASSAQRAEVPTFLPQALLELFSYPAGTVIAPTKLQGASEVSHPYRDRTEKHWYLVEVEAAVSYKTKFLPPSVDPPEGPLEVMTFPLDANGDVDGDIHGSSVAHGDDGVSEDEFNVAGGDLRRLFVIGSLDALSVAEANYVFAILPV
jgi:hypothetical protein